MVQQEPDILAAAEALLESSASYQRNVNFSINSPMDHVTESFYTGSRADGKMSVVRRFFCLFVTFDLLFITLMWLICIMLSGDDVFLALSKQIVHYDIHASLFDVVMIAACRFVILLLFYALLYINHWYMIALTTAGTCAFLIGKVFIYDWPKAQSPVLQVLLILISFVLAWSEAWFLDFRVLPQESQALNFMRGASFVPRTSEQTPLLRHFLHSVALTQDVPESVANYYSPVNSPQESDDEEEAQGELNKKEVDSRLKQVQHAEWRVRATEIVAEALRILHDQDWSLKLETPEGDNIHTKKVNGSRVYRVVGIVDLPPREMLDLLFYRIEDLPKWNTDVLVCKQLEVIDDQTDIIYQVTKEAGNGVVASRDFVNLRHWVLVDDCYVSAFASVNYIPLNSDYIRGENGPSGWTLKPVEGDPNKCNFEWLLNVNMKLGKFVPKVFMDRPFMAAISDCMRNLRVQIRRSSSCRQSLS